MLPPNSNTNRNRLLRQYAGIASQFVISIGAGVFIGLKLDKWIKIQIPLLVWILPLLIIIITILKLIKDTSKKE